ncbi:MAG: type I-E CRISPR-associated protein Cas5/CasD [Pseudomonadota bacterium]|jgi:CRISPR system Cascade subunit CasD
MPQYLIFQIKGAMASWGEAAVGEYRGSDDRPTASALGGLLAAALGLRRDQEADLQALHAGYLFGVEVCESGALLRDYHTIQVPGRSTLKGQKHVTRKDELAFRRTDLNTILSTRDHRLGVHHLVAVQAHAHAPHTLARLREALLKPAFVLYLGRKSCPLSAPLHPCVIDAEHLMAAFVQYRHGLAGNADAGLPRALAWTDGMEAGMPSHLSVTRKDRLIHRGAWQHGERVEHLAMLQATAERA